MLHRVLGRTDRERRVAINTIGPFWDGNEVWLVVGGAAIFAAFPDWYASWFSASYLAGPAAPGGADHPRRVLRVPRQGRPARLAPAVERHSDDRQPGCAARARDRARLTWWRGLPIDADGEYTGTFWDLFTPFGLWTGLTMVVLCLMNGATFLGIRTTGELRERAHRAARWIGWAGLVVVTAFAVWILVVADHGWGPVVVLVIAPGGHGRLRLGRAPGTRRCRVHAVVGGDGLYRGGTVRRPSTPRFLVSSTDSANSLTVQNAASGHYALTVDERRRPGVPPPGAALPGLVLLRVPSSAEYLGQSSNRDEASGPY